MKLITFINIYIICNLKIQRFAWMIYVELLANSEGE